MCVMDFVQKTLLRDERETEAFAKNFAVQLTGGKDVICLSGGLGAGKTLFCRALIRALCQEEGMDVPSPTFTLVQQYDAADGRIIWHFDLYRLEEPEEVYETGWEEALADGIVLVEWPEKLGSLLPAVRKDVILSAVDGEPNARLIEVKRYG